MPMNDVPVFGEVDRATSYKVRPSAYAVVMNDAGGIAVVRGANGYYLPGGGIEGGEDAEAAVARECFEECGLRVRLLSSIGSAIQLLFAPGEGWFRIEGQFYFAQVDGAQVDALSDTFSWAEPELAADLMTRAFERWAIETWRSGRQVRNG